MAGARLVTFEARVVFIATRELDSKNIKLGMVMLAPCCLVYQLAVNAVASDIDKTLFLT